MMDRNQDILFLDMSQVDQAQDLFFWERGRGRTEVDQKQDFFLFLGNITNGPETRLCFFLVGRGGQKQDFGDNWIPETLSKMQVAPGWPFSAEIWRHVHLYPLGAASSSQLQWREELMDFNALLTRESE
ncbi:hypothetical protein BDL97_01G168700 [Sphagnum fallax]|jgi:hypothetical protein|nr:hypothetical protein BDL97_01G168700 [Sphagnum fallax]